MRKLPHIDPDSQLAHFRAAVQLRGGVRSAARELGCNDRTLYSLVYGERDLHDGWLRDMAAALIKHADTCRALERKISPAFVGNLTTAQQTEKPHHNRFDRKPTGIDGDDRRAAPQGRPAARSRATAGSNSGEDKGADAPAKGENPNG